MDQPAPTRRVALALEAPPSPEGGAAGRVALALATGLREHGVHVSVLAPLLRGRAVPADVPAQVRLVDDADERGRIRINVERLLRPRGELARGRYLHAVQAAARESGLLHCEQLMASWLGEGLDVPVVVHLHQLTLADRDLGLPWSRSFREVGEFALAERRAARRHRVFVASSPVVADYVRRHNRNARIVHAPLSLVAEHYAQASLEGPPVAGIIGWGGWAPTRSAVQRLVGRIWPRVRAEVPDAVLRIAGWGMADLPELREPGPGIEVVGAVDRSVEFLTDLSLLLYPLPRGSGMKVKVLEALACGLPVVTTGCGAEGVAADPGLAVHDDDAALARAAVELLRDGAARRERGGSARALFERRYAPGPATAPVAALYDALRG